MNTKHNDNPKDYQSLSDTELLNMYNNLEENRRPIPRDLPEELHKRKLLKSYTGIWHSGRKPPGK